MDDLIWGLVVIGIVVGLPWLIMHYVTRWKTAATLTGGDERLLEELHDLARRLDDRMCSIERIMTAENPNWRQQCAPEQQALSDSSSRGLDMDLDAEFARLAERSRMREVR
ncbi:envelope stress response membrane protein PspB [Sphingomonas sp. LHG3443-2]|uniref:envelope stress response membrane protein PspB n=1 Tax=Sphingomonas sp. LHG3443-2 TaxID=2804639 RepID=UPI003CF319F5